jgi:serine/threonine protein kinase
MRMAQSVTCPPESVLSNFGLGKLDAADAETISQHLETCADCQQRLVSLSSDSFVGRLQKADRAAQQAKRQRTYVPGESMANSANSTDGSLIKDDGPSGSSQSSDNLARRIAPGSPSPVVAPPELANHPDYELIKELGQGGMGTVYLAKNRMMGRLEVLKVISQAVLNKSGARERFLQEIQAAARLNQPNIVAAYSVLRLGDILVFSMEYVKGQDLEKLVSARGYLPVANAAFYIHQVALGLQHAHERGMVHRDIKPNNLMLAIEGKKHVVKILDFGLAKATSEKDAETRQTKSGQMLGTPLFVSPEQISDARSADIRADVYSLGCTLYYLLSGRPPFQDESLFELLRAHHEREATPLNVVRPDVPVELAALVGKMMAKDPTKRYQTPIEVARALVPFFKPGQSVATAPPGDIPLAPPTSETEYGLATVTSTSAPTPATPLPASDPLFPSQADILPDPTVEPPAVLRSRVIKAPPAGPERSQPSVKPWYRPSLPVGIGVALALSALALVLWAVVFRIRTADGTLVVQVNEANPDLYVDGERVTVAWQDGGVMAEVGIKPGTRKVELKKNGFRVYGKEVTLEDRGRTVLTARLDPVDPPDEPINPPDEKPEAPEDENGRISEDNKGENRGPTDGHHQVAPQEPNLRPRTPAELAAIKNADIDRGKSLLASTDPDEIAEIVGQIAPGFTAELPVIPAGVAIVAEHFGRTRVLSTHPLDADRPCILTSTIDVPADKETSLTFDVSHSAAGDWQLIVLANGESLYEGTVGPTTPGNRWVAVSVDLTPFAGKQVVLQLQNKATGYSHEWGFWDRVKIASREIERPDLDAPVSSEDEEGSHAGQERNDNALKMKLCWCPAAATPGFWIGKYEVTQSEWAALMGSMPSLPLERGKGPQHPIYNVSLDAAIEFCRKLTERERDAGRLSPGWAYRLPTEEQWEYACRAGTTTATAFGDSLSSKQANFNGDLPYNDGQIGPNLQKAVKVGSYRPNAWGIYDMHGNVKEFTTTPGHVRGGSWWDSGRNCCSEIFIPDPPDPSQSIGFRVIRVPSEEVKGVISKAVGRILKGASSKALKRLVPGTMSSETPSAEPPTPTTLKVVVPAIRTMGLTQASLLDSAADTGLLVTKGQHIRLVVTGTVSLENQAVGKPRAQKARKRKPSPKPGEDVIVCAIGWPRNSAEQRVQGRPAMDFVAECSGSLFIGIADDSRVDNEGSLTVEIRVD